MDKAQALTEPPLPREILTAFERARDAALNLVLEQAGNWRSAASRTACEPRWSSATASSRRTRRWWRARPGAADASAGHDRPLGKHPP